MSRNASPPLVAGGTIYPHRFVKVSAAADNTALQAGLNDPTIGISQIGTKTAPGVDGAVTYAAAATDPIEIFGLGDTPVLLEVGTGGWTAGDFLGPDANGLGVTITTGLAGAVALETVTAGKLGRVQIIQQRIGVGYVTGQGGAVTQASSASTGVTLNKPCGQITTVALTTAAAAEVRFTVSNTSVAATDVIALSTTYAGGGTPMLSVTAVGANTFDIVITNVHASAAFDALMVINFAVIKAVAA